MWMCLGSLFVTTCMFYFSTVTMAERGLRRGRRVFMMWASLAGLVVMGKGRVNCTVRQSGIKETKGRSRNDGPCSNFRSGKFKFA
jgi:hypothetical protein